MSKSSMELHCCNSACSYSHLGVKGHELDWQLQLAGFQIIQLGDKATSPSSYTQLGMPCNDLQHCKASGSKSQAKFCVHLLMRSDQLMTCILLIVSSASVLKQQYCPLMVFLTGTTLNVCIASRALAAFTMPTIRQSSYYSSYFCWRFSCRIDAYHRRSSGSFAKQYKTHSLHCIPAVLVNIQSEWVSE